MPSLIGAAQPPKGRFKKQTKHLIRHTTEPTINGVLPFDLKLNGPHQRFHPDIFAIQRQCFAHAPA
jgi:hypothetical protein